MGMFDNLDCSKSGLSLKCAHGHDTCKEDFQTKDLDCVMDLYHIIDGNLFHTIYNLEEDTVTSSNYTGQIRFYADCTQCPMSKWKKKDEEVPKWGPQISMPWVEYLVLVNEGKIIVVKEVKLETVEESRSQMLKYNWEEIT